MQAEEYVEIAIKPEIMDLDIVVHPYICLLAAQTHHLWDVVSSAYEEVRARRQGGCAVGLKSAVMLYARICMRNELDWNSLHCDRQITLCGCVCVRITCPSVYSCTFKPLVRPTCHFVHQVLQKYHNSGEITRCCLCTIIPCYLFANVDCRPNRDK